MKEDLLHFVWKYRLYDGTMLKTTNGESIEVIRPGIYNTNAGADFSNARIRIGDVQLAGNVELHIHAKDWYTHHHDEDKAYNNVILHVVYEDDGTAPLTESGQTIPVISLKEQISPELLHRYDMLKSSKEIIPCAAMIDRLPKDFFFASFYDRLVIERLQGKVSIVEALLESSTNDWDQVAFQMVAMYFGGSVNKEPFAQLSSSLPLQIIHKHRAESLQLEALLFGQSGLIATDHDDDYPQTLKREYAYLKKLHSLKPNEGHAWKFFRVRPVSFPTIKIAQLAAWLSKEPHPFNAILSCSSLSEMRDLFDVDVNPYWETHFQFDKPVAKTNVRLGNMLTDVVLINAVVPLLFSYGRYKDDEAICERALELLTEMEAEDNSIIRMWDSLGIRAKTANDSQALIQLHNQYCLNKKCLSCEIGHKLLSPASVDL